MSGVLGHQIQTFKDKSDALAIMAKLRQGFAFLFV